MSIQLGEGGMGEFWASSRSVSILASCPDHPAAFRSALGEATMVRTKVPPLLSYLWGDRPGSDVPCPGPAASFLPASQAR